MNNLSKSPTQTWLDSLRICLKIVAFLAGFVAGYVWFLMLGYIDVLSNSGGMDGSLQLYGVGYALDSVCLILLVIAFFIRNRLIGVAVAGLAVAGLSFLLRLLEYRIAGQMFWFEPYLRSGIYVLAFGSAYFAWRIPRGRRSSGTSNLLDSTNEATRR